MPSILLVTAMWPPSRLIGGKRALRMARGLHARGWQVTVATLQPPYMQPLDPQEKPPPEIEFIATHALMPRAWLPVKHPQPQTQNQNQQAQPKTQTLRSRAGKLLRALEFPDEYAGWLPLMVPRLVGRKFDVVLATLPPPTAAVIAATVAKLGRAKLVLDYRDPWTEILSADEKNSALDRQVSARLLKRHQTLETRILQQASLVLGVTPQICAWLQPRTSAPVEFLPNGLEQLPPPAVMRDVPLRLVYGGSLAYQRSLDGLLAAIHALRETYAPARLRLQYAGPHGAQLRAAAQQIGVEAWLDDLGSLPQREVLKLYHGAAAGIVAVSAPTAYSYPGKLFEILAAGCPIWLCGPQQCEAAKLVRQLHAGQVDDGEDLHAMTAKLRAFLLAEPQPAKGLETWLGEVQMAKLDRKLRAIL